MTKQCNNLFNLHCDIHYYSAKFEIKIQLMYERNKDKLYYGGKMNKLYNLGVN